MKENKELAIVHNGKVFIPMVCTKEHFFYWANTRWVIPIGTKGNLRVLGNTWIISTDGDIKPYAEIDGNSTTSLIEYKDKRLILTNWVSCNGYDLEWLFKNQTYTMTEKEYNNSIEIKENLRNLNNEINKFVGNINKILSD